MRERERERESVCRLRAVLLVHVLSRFQRLVLSLAPPIIKAATSTMGMKESIRSINIRSTSTRSISIRSISTRTSSS